MQSSSITYLFIAIILVFGSSPICSQNQYSNRLTLKNNDPLNASNQQEEILIKEKNRHNHSTLIITEYYELEKATGKLLDKLSTLTVTNSIKITPSISAFTLHFSLVDNFYSTHNSFAYKVEGLDTEWNEIKEDHLRIYNLPYGSYLLSIKGKRYNGEWTTNNLSIPIEVIKPYYLQWWFFVSIGFSIMALSFLVFKNRLTRLQQSKNELEKLVALRTQKVQEDKILIEQQYKELEFLNKNKDKLFTIIAHDLRDPAHTFIGLSKKLRYLIQHQQWDRLESFGGYMEQSADSLHKMLDNLLVWATTQQKNIATQLTAFAIFPLFTEFLPVFQMKARENGILINTIDAEANFSVYADREMVTIILRNILDNALKFSKKGDCIKISTYAINEDIAISIQDEGIGIPVEMIPNLFSIDQKNIRRGTTGLKGAGLGLSLCKEFVELNQGRIMVENIVPNGTKISIFLPNSLFINHLSSIEPSFYEV